MGSSSFAVYLTCKAIMNQLTLPELYCPFPSQVNKYADVLEDYAFDWVLRFDLLANELSYKRFCKSKFFLLSASAYPYCQLEELKVANDWISWLFIWDDHCDVSDLGKKPDVLKVFNNRFLEILKGAELTNQDIPLGYALSDLRQRMLQIGSKKRFSYFILAVKNYFDGCVRESANRAQGIVPNFETYPTIRSLSGAMDSVFELIEFCDHLALPDFLRHYEIIKKIKLMANNIVCWANDIVSVFKEMEKGDCHNLVLVLHFQEQMPLEKAIKIAASIHNQEIKKMLYLEEYIPSFGKEVDAEIVKYISGIHTWISGNLDWGSRSARYRSVENMELVLF
jgi:5-epi-alpha-selinene synthase